MKTAAIILIFIYSSLIGASESLTTVSTKNLQTPEKLGIPVKNYKVSSFSYSTCQENGSTWIWGAAHGGYESAIVGVDIKTGQTRTYAFSERRFTRFTPVSDAKLALFGRYGGWYLDVLDLTTGLRTNIAEEHSLTGDPNRSSYTYPIIRGQGETVYLGYDFGENSRHELVQVNLETGERVNYGPVSRRDDQNYLMDMLSDKKGNIYISLGFREAEISVFNPSTGKIRHLGSVLGAESNTTGQRIQLQRDIEGNVYAVISGRTHLCNLFGLTEVEKEPVWESPLRIADSQASAFINSEGVLVIKFVDGRVNTLQTDYEGLGAGFMTLGEEYKGLIFGGTINPSRVFWYDPDSKTFTDTKGNYSHQVYKVKSLADRGLLFSDYPAGRIWVFDPTSDSQSDYPTKPINVGAFYKDGLERLYDFVDGQDGFLYIPCRAIKGEQEGAIIRFDPKTLNSEVVKPVIKNQTISSLINLENTDYLLGSTSIWGGTASGSSTEAPYIFLWSKTKKELVDKFQPIQSVTSYYSLTSGKDNMVFGIGAQEDDYHDTKDVSRGKILWFSINPQTLEVVARGSMGKIQQIRSHGMIEWPGNNPIGIGVDESGMGVIFSLDTKSNTPIILYEHESLATGKGLFIDSDQDYFYYGSRSELYRLPLSALK